MLLTFIITSFVYAAFTFIHSLTSALNWTVTFPLGFATALSDFISAACYFVPLPVLPLLGVVFIFWTLRIMNAVIRGILEVIDRFPLIGWITG